MKGIGKEKLDLANYQRKKTNHKGYPNYPLANYSSHLSEPRLVIVGEGGVGKSAMTIQFIQRKFIEDYDPTIEDSYCLETNFDTSHVKIHILDTAGQDDYNAMRPQFMRGGDGFVVVFSLCERKTFDKIPDFIEQIFKIKDGWFPCVVCGNKADVSPREVTVEEGKTIADKYQFPYIETSAKTRYNIEEVFFEAVRGALWYKYCVNEEKRPEDTRPSRLSFACVLL